MNRGHVYGLDGLRALAILGVVFYHMVPNILPGGYLGVTLFFTIMGYLMVYPAARVGKAIDTEWVYGGAFFGTLSFAMDYYKKKIRRLYPPLLMMLCLGLLGIILLVPNYAKGSIPEVASIIFGYNNWWQIAQNASYFERMLNSSPFTHLWYMGLTVQYYLIWPVMFACGHGIYKRFVQNNDDRAVKILFVIVLLGLATLSGWEMSFLYDPEVDPSRLYYGTDTRAFSLLFGIAIGLLPIERLSDGVALVLIRIGSVVLLAALFFSYFRVTGESADNYHYQMQLVSLGFAVLTVAVLFDQDGIAQLADILPLRIIGRYSYEIYLVMYPVIYFVQKKKGDMSNLLYVATCIVFIAAAATIVHAIPVLFDWFAEYYNAWIGRVAGAVLLIGCIILCGTQTAIAKNNGGTDDMVALEQELVENAANLNERNDEQMINSLNAQLASVNDTVNQQTEFVRVAAETRMLAGAEYAAVAMAQQQEAAAQAAAQAQQVQATVGVTAIGDSVMLGAANVLQSQIPGIYVNAAVSRQVTAGPDLIRSLAAQGLLGQTVVVHLGTNGVSTLPRYQEIVDTIGPDHQIYWVNCIGPSWAGDVNVNVQAVCDANPNVTMINWLMTGAGHPEYFGSDGIHLTQSGKNAYAAMIKAAIGM